MGIKAVKDMSIHDEPTNHMRPYVNYGNHDPDNQPWQHPDTELYSGLDAPNSVDCCAFLEEQRSKQGFPLTHKPVDTTLRFYTDQDVQRSCPSV
jgi:hypothetical protein